MTATRINIDASLAASLVHGGGTDDSNIVLFRRESIVQPDGAIIDVPTFSGNGWRGVLRRSGAWLLAELLGLDGQLGIKAVRIISSGGALVQEKALPVDQERQLRTVPHLALFGWSGAGMIHAGSLVVSKLTPVCAETAHITGVASEVPSGRLLDIEQFTRHDSSPITPADPDPGTETETSQMIYQVETLSAGTRLIGHLATKPWATSEQVDWLHAVLRHWTETGSHLGGRSATGHGRLVVGDVIDEAAADRAVQWHRDHADELVEALGWLS